MFIQQLSQYADAVGLVGVALVLVSYYFLNIGKVTSEHLSYIILNLLGSLMLLFSLYYSWNLASVLIEVAWILISLLGLRRYMQLRKLNCSQSQVE